MAEKKRTITRQVMLSPEHQMILKYLVKLLGHGASRDEIALALEHAFNGFTLQDSLAIRSLVEEERNIPLLDASLRARTPSPLEVSIGPGGALVSTRRLDA